MIEKVNPSHPDKVADRIAGALVDMAYQMDENPKIAVEVLIGHSFCNIIAETSEVLNVSDVHAVVNRIAGKEIRTTFLQFPQDASLAKNQENRVRCGDNGIFKGVPLTDEQRELSMIARDIYNTYRSDGKYVLDGEKLIICQSNAKTEDIRKAYPKAIINPLGEWTGGCDVDTGCTNRKLGSDMADSVTGGGINGKDLSKADVSVNIYAFLKAQKTGEKVELSCAIGDEFIDGKPYGEIVAIARKFVKTLGGFEKLAEWGLF